MTANNRDHQSLGNADGVEGSDARQGISPEYPTVFPAGILDDKAGPKASASFLRDKDIISSPRSCWPFPEVPTLVCALHL